MGTVNPFDDTSEPLIAVDGDFARGQDRLSKESPAFFGGPVNAIWQQARAAQTDLKVPFVSRETIGVIAAERAAVGIAIAMHGDAHAPDVSAAAVAVERIINRGQAIPESCHSSGEQMGKAIAAEASPKQKDASKAATRLQSARIVTRHPKDVPLNGGRFCGAARYPSTCCQSTCRFFGLRD